jgi:hypothetical protein
VAWANWHGVRSKGWKSPLWFTAAVGIAFAGAAAVTGSISGADAAVSAFGLAFAGAVAFALAGGVTGAGSVGDAFASINTFAGAGTVEGAVGGAVAGASAVAVAVAVAVASAVAVLNRVSIKYRWQGVFLSLYFLGLVICCLGAAALLSRSERWEDVGPLLLFLGLLTLINAPFDWASLGFTRALLRRGLELGGWWPYTFAVVDAVFAAGLIAVRAPAMAIGVQIFDRLAEQGGADAVLPLAPIFDGVAANPGAPEYWWAYALLLSTMIPSLVNLMIGGASLLRGVPGVSALLLRFIPAGKAVPAFDRSWIALVLTVQVFAGAFFGIAAQAFLALGVIFYLLPRLGLGLLDTVRDVVGLDLPTHVLDWLFG